MATTSSMTTVFEGSKAKVGSSSDTSTTPTALGRTSPESSTTAATCWAWRPRRPGRKRGGGGHRRRVGGRLQDGEPQPPELHRAVPGRRHRRGRNPPGRLHYGSAPDRTAQLLAIRRRDAPQDALPPRR